MLASGSHVKSYRKKANDFKKVKRSQELERKKGLGTVNVTSDLLKLVGNERRITRISLEAQSDIQK